jgi:hypothetical protein
MSGEDPPTARSTVPVTHGRFRVELKEWDSAFFDRPIGTLTWSGGPLLNQTRSADRAALRELCVSVDEAGYRLVECQVNVSEFAAAGCVESAGFRLVDSRLRFLTRWRPAETDPVDPSWGRIRAATVEDRERIIELTHEGFTYNDGFDSRFKNPEYFSIEETRRYYEAWIDSTAYADDAVTAVFEVEGEVVGYYIYQVRGTHEGLPVVKAVLTTVARAQRGAGAHLAMQSFLYRRLGLVECYLDNVTQLGNVAVIRNHMRSGKRYEQTALTFYRSRG